MVAQKQTARKGKQEMATKMTQPLEVDAFDIDIETLDDATRNGHIGDMARHCLVMEMEKNLTLDSKKRFDKYQDNNDACKEGE